MDMKRDYYEDVQLFSSGVIVFWFIVLIAFLALYPFLFKNYYVYVANYIAINIIVVIGLNILVGYTGQISLGHAGFFCIGAYGTIILMTKAHFPFLLALPAAALVAAFFGFLLGLPALRLEGPYLAIATLGFGITITQVIGRMEFFGGRQGLHAPDLIVGPWHLNSDRDFYYLLIPITVLLAIAARNLIKTKIGRAFIAIRDADIAAETMGVNLLLYKTLAFAVSAFYAGIAGDDVHLVSCNGGGRWLRLNDGLYYRCCFIELARFTAPQYNEHSIHRGVAGSIIQKLFFYYRGFEHPANCLRVDYDFDYAV